MGRTIDDQIVEYLERFRSIRYFCLFEGLITYWDPDQQILMKMRVEVDRMAVACRKYLSNSGGNCETVFDINKLARYRNWENWTDLRVR